jgi:hypothetical protein
MIKNPQIFGAKHVFHIKLTPEIRAPLVCKINIQHSAFYTKTPAFDHHAK